MTRYIAEYEAAFYDGERVGDPDPSGAVKDQTCPHWFPTPNRTVTSNHMSWKDIADGEVVIHEPQGVPPTLCIRDGNTMRCASPGTWIAYAGGKLWPLSLPAPILLKRKP
jgi:hypothetical protein